MKNVSNRDGIMAIIIVVAFISFPFFLNWILQKPSLTSVIGDDVTWLSFWGTYIGSILTALMVFVTFVTLRKTINLNKIQWRIDWLNSYREAAANILVATDSSEVNQIAQDIEFGEYDKAVVSGQKMSIKVKRSSFVLTSVLKEYSDVFGVNKSDSYVDQLNDFIEPFLVRTGEIIQFAIICKYLKNKINTGELVEGKDTLMRMSDDMKDAGYDVIVQAIKDFQSCDFKMIVHDSIVTMLKNLDKANIQGLEKILLNIGLYNSRMAYGYALFSIGKRKSS